MKWWLLNIRLAGLKISIRWMINLLFVVVVEALWWIRFCRIFKVLTLGGTAHTILRKLLFSKHEMHYS